MSKALFQISTVGLHPSKKSAAWMDILHQLGITGCSTIADPEHFSASVSHYGFGQTSLNFWDIAAGHDKNFEHTLARDPSGTDYTLCYIKKGRITAQQAGRETVVDQGDLTLVNMQAPALLGTESSLDMLTLHISQEIIENWIPYPQDLTAISFSKQSHWGKVLAAAMEALNPTTLDQLAVPPYAVVEQINCLLALTIGVPDETIGGHKSSTLRRLRQTIRKNFQDSEFSPAFLASEEGISKRTIHNIFAKAGSSFRAELRDLRMKQAQQFLDDPRFDKKTISEIAQLVGFDHASNFVTQFRQVYGVTPSAYRAVRRS